MVPMAFLISYPRTRGVRELQLHRLAALIVRIIQYRDRHRPGGLPGGKRQRPAGGGIVLPGNRRPVPREIVHRHRTRRGPAQAHHKVQLRTCAFLHGGIGHRYPHRTVDPRREGGRVRAPILRAHSTRRPAGRRWRERHRHRLVGGGFDPDPPMVEPPVLLAYPRLRTPGHPEQRPDVRLRALRHRRVEGKLQPERRLPVMLRRYGRETRRERSEGLLTLRHRTGHLQGGSNRQHHALRRAQRARLRARTLQRREYRHRTAPGGLKRQLPQVLAPVHLRGGRHRPAAHHQRMVAHVLAALSPHPR